MKNRLYGHCDCCARKIYEETHISIDLYRVYEEGNEIQPVRHKPIGTLCLKCIDETLIKYMKENKCSVCGKKFDDYEEYWNLTYTKQAYIDGIIEPEYGLDIANYHHYCTNRKDIILELNIATWEAMKKSNHLFTGELFIKKEKWHRCGHSKR